MLYQNSQVAEAVYTRNQRIIDLFLSLSEKEYGILYDIQIGAEAAAQCGDIENWKKLVGVEVNIYEKNEKNAALLTDYCCKAATVGHLEFIREVTKLQEVDFYSIATSGLNSRSLELFRFCEENTTFSGAEYYEFAIRACTKHAKDLILHCIEHVSFEKPTESKTDWIRSLRNRHARERNSAVDEEITIHKRESILLKEAIKIGDTNVLQRVFEKTGRDHELLKKLILNSVTHQHVSVEMFTYIIHTVGESILHEACNRAIETPLRDLSLSSLNSLRTCEEASEELREVANSIHEYLRCTKETDSFLASDKFNYTVIGRISKPLVFSSEEKLLQAVDKLGSSELVRNLETKHQSITEFLKQKISAKTEVVELFFSAPVNEFDAKTRIEILANPTVTELLLQNTLTAQDLLGLTKNVQKTKTAKI